MGNESSSHSHSPLNVGEMRDNIMNIGPCPGPLDPGYMDYVKYDLERQREERFRPKSMEEIIHNKMCKDIGWKPSDGFINRKPSNDNWTSFPNRSDYRNSNSSIDHVLHKHDPFDKNPKSFFSGIPRKTPYKKSEYKPPSRTDPKFFKPGSVVKDEATGLIVAGWKEKDTRTPSEFKKAVHKFKESLCESVVTNSAMGMPTGVDDVVGAVIDAVDPIERSDSEKLVRSVCSLIPVVNVLEKVERVMEIQVHREFEYFKVVKQEFLDAGFSDKDAEYWAYKTTSID